MEDTVFIFRKKENGKCECEIDGKVYPCSSFKEAVFIFNMYCIKKGELQ
jgi:hypothetical protein